MDFEPFPILFDLEYFLKLHVLGELKNLWQIRIRRTRIALKKDVVFLGDLLQSPWGVSLGWGPALLEKKGKQ